jgi:hypothetical protein
VLRTHSSDGTDPGIARLLRLFFFLFFFSGTLEDRDLDREVLRAGSSPVLSSSPEEPAASAELELGLEPFEARCDEPDLRGPFGFSGRLRTE